MSLRSYENPTRSIDVCLGGFGWKVMFFDEGLNSTILNKIYQSLSDYLSAHSKMLVIRFDLSLYCNPNDNKTIAKIINNTKVHLTKQYSSDVGYCWVREISTDDKAHYHCFILLNGHKAKTSKRVFDAVKHSLRLVIDVNCYFPENCYYIVKRDDLTSLQATLYRLSYLAKNASKQGKPAQVKSYQFNRAIRRKKR